MKTPLLAAFLALPRLALAQDACVAEPAGAMNALAAQVAQISSVAVKGVDGRLVDGFLMIPDAAGGGCTASPLEPRASSQNGASRDAGAEMSDVTPPDMGLYGAVERIRAPSQSRGLEERAQGDGAGPRGRPAPAKEPIVYVNGILTSPARHCETLHAIQRATCSPVIGVYNNTHGFASDLKETAVDRFALLASPLLRRLGMDGLPFKEKRTPAGRALTKFVEQTLADGNKPRVWAHSQGGAITSLALFDAREGRAPIQDVEVVSLASASPMWPDGPRYEHFVHMRDLVPVALGMGNPLFRSWRAGAGAEIYKVAGQLNSSLTPLAADAKPMLRMPYFGKYHDMPDVYLKSWTAFHGPCGARKIDP